MTGYIKDNGSYKQVDESYVKVDGAWRRVIKAYVKVQGEWKQWYLVPPDKVIISSVVDQGASRAYNNGQFSVSISLSPGSQIVADSFRVVATSAGNPTIDVTSATSPVTLSGLKSNVSYSIVAYAINNDGQSAPSDVAYKTATTIPATPSAPSVSTQVNQDNVSWAAPQSGGQSITNYQWESSDSKGGTTTQTSIAVAQEGGTSQSYRVRAYNANGWSEWSPWSGSVTTTPPFFPPFFPWFPPFFPWFPPFFPWFPPWFPPYFPWFVPNPWNCIAAETMIATTNGDKKAEHISVGDTVISYDIAELPIDDEEGMFSWSSKTLTIRNTVEATVVSVEHKPAQIIMFNDDESMRYSTSQPMFVKKDNVYKILPTSMIDIGDILVSIDPSGKIEEIGVVSIDTEDLAGHTYQINCEPYDWFIAGGCLVHNK